MQGLDLEASLTEQPTVFVLTAEVQLPAERESQDFHH
jgi:hypothetical protein